MLVIVAVFITVLIVSDIKENERRKHPPTPTVIPTTTATVFRLEDCDVVITNDSYEIFCKNS